MVIRCLTFKFLLYIIQQLYSSKLFLHYDECSAEISLNQDNTQGL